MARKPINISVSAAMTSPLLFEPYFRGPSWNVWLAILKAAYAEPLSDTEKAAFEAVAARQPPAKRVNELVVCAGRGAGKDSIASLIVTVTAINHSPRIYRPGEKVRVMAIACDRHQAGILFGYVRGFFEEIPALKAMVRHISAESIELTNNILIEVHTNSFRAVRGRGILCAVLDECAFYRGEDSALSDAELDAALTPGLDRVPGSMKILISSVHKRSGLLYQKYRDYYGKDDPKTLVVYGGTRSFNSSYSEETIDRAVESDPALYGAEYLSIWRDDLSSYISEDLLDAAVDPGVVVRPPVMGAEYQAACDVSGGRGSSFCAAISHKEPGGLVVLDAVFEAKAPFNPSAVVAEVAAILKNYGVSSIVGDHYGANWVVEAFSKVGIKYIKSERDRSEIYMDTLPLFTSGRVRLLDNKRLLSQFASLERRSFPTGRTRIDPGAGGDDLCNAVAIALTLVGCESAPSLVQYRDLFVNGAPIPDAWDAHAHYNYFFSVACDASGKCAVISWAGHPHLRPSLVLRDFECGYFTERRFAPYARLLAICYSACSSRRVAAIAEGIYEATEHDVVTDFGIATTAASFVESGRVKITKAAHIKSEGAPLGHALDFRHDKLQDPLPAAAIVGVYKGLCPG